MNHQQKLDAIRLACIEVNPEITKVQFGCKYRVKNRPKQIFRFISDHEISSVKDVEKEIIGRDIQLHDIVLLLKDDWTIKNVETGEEDLTIIMNILKKILEKWNLLLPLHLQEESTISFIYELIK